MKVDALPQDLEAGGVGDLPAEAGDDFAAVRGVGDAAAAHADEVDVGRHVAFVAGLAGEGQFLDEAAFGQHAEGGIDGGQGHGGEMLLYALVDLLHRGVVGGVEHRLGDGQPLGGDPHAAGAQLLHHSVLYHRSSVWRIRAGAGAGAAAFPTSIATARRYRKRRRVRPGRLFRPDGLMYQGIPAPVALLRRAGFD